MEDTYSTRGDFGEVFHGLFSKKRKLSYRVHVHHDLNNEMCFCFRFQDNEVVTLLSSALLDKLETTPQMRFEEQQVVYYLFLQAE